MNAHYRTLPAIGVATSIVVLAALLSFSARLPWHGATTGIERPAGIGRAKTRSLGQKVPLSHTIAIADVAGSALRDMRAHAIRLGSYAEVPDSFGATRQWSPEWHLQWLDVEHHGTVTRIYHATHVRNPHLRFIAIWNDDHAVWERVY